MASSSPSSLLILLTLTTPLLLGLITSSQVQAKSDESVDPVPVSTDLIAILDKGGQYKTFIRLLASTQVSNQISNQLRSSDQGTTVFAPTDNAFNSLKPGTLNGLSVQQQVGLVLYHVLPKYYSLYMFEAVSNPVRTQATGQDGGAYNLNFTSNPNQVNVSTGVVAIQLNNALQQRFPLAVYEVDKVLLPLDLFGPKPKPHRAPVPVSVPVPVPVPAPALAPPPLTKDKKSPSSTVTVSSGSAPKMDLALMGGLGLVAMSVLTY